MSDLAAQFAQAAEDVQGLSERPDNETLLRLYALFKQGSNGDATGKRPGAINFVKRAKFDAWAAISGTSQDDAMQQYIDLVTSLRDR